MQGGRASLPAREASNSRVSSSACFSVAGATPVGTLFAQTRTLDLTKQSRYSWRSVSSSYEYQRGRKGREQMKNGMKPVEEVVTASPTGLSLSRVCLWCVCIPRRWMAEVAWWQDEMEVAVGARVVADGCVSEGGGWMENQGQGQSVSPQNDEEGACGSSNPVTPKISSENLACIPQLCHIDTNIPWNQKYIIIGFKLGHFNPSITFSFIQSKIHFFIVIIIIIIIKVYSFLFLTLL